MRTRASAVVRPGVTPEQTMRRRWRALISCAEATGVLFPVQRSHSQRVRLSGEAPDAGPSVDGRTGVSFGKTRTWPGPR